MTQHVGKDGKARKQPAKRDRRRFNDGGALTKRNASRAAERAANVGPNSTGEIERLQARITELGAENNRLRLRHDDAPAEPLEQARERYARCLEKIPSREALIEEAKALLVDFRLTVTAITSGPGRRGNKLSDPDGLDALGGTGTEAVPPGLRRSRAGA